MKGRHYKSNPYSLTELPDRYEMWEQGWREGRIILEWDNPAHIPVKVLKRENPKIAPRLIPFNEEIPIVLDGCLFP
jgi:hypothetical protein